MLLAESESEFVTKLTKYKIDIKQLKSNPKKCLTIKMALS